MTLFHTISQQCSRFTTETYSSSFSSAIRLLHKDLRNPVYNIYGLVRFADEIVDTFHDYDKATLLQQFKQQTFEAIEKGISLNPVLQSFQRTVNAYQIDHRLIHAFFNSMEMDLHQQQHTRNSYEQYIFGSAEAVGLMCLHVFCHNEPALFEELQPYARSLGAAFQKVNFLRDLQADAQQLQRVYFPGVNFKELSPRMKTQIEEEIMDDFRHAYEGILQLPLKARFGVYVAYQYYLSLFKKIKRTQPSRILATRIRIPAYAKAMIVVRAGVKSQLNLI